MTVIFVTLFLTQRCLAHVEYQNTAKPEAKILGEVET